MELAYVITLINDVIDFEASEESDHVCVKPDINAELDALKQQNEGLVSFLVCHFTASCAAFHLQTQVANEEIVKAPAELVNSLSVVFFNVGCFLRDDH